MNYEKGRKHSRIRMDDGVINSKEFKTDAKK